MLSATDYMKDEYGALCFQYEYRVASLDPDQRRQVPSGQSNSAAWVCWHMYRNEDVLVNSIIQSRPQIFDGGWSGRLGINDNAIGTGYSTSEVRAFSHRIDAAVLDLYCREVMSGTQAWLSGLHDADLTTIPDVDARLAERPDILGPGSEWVPGVWRGRCASQVFAYFVIGHGYTHVGEIEGIRAALGLKGL